VDIAEVVSIVKDNLHVKIEETFGNIMCGELPRVVSMQSLLVQLFQNLIGNALKFSRPDSRPIVLINAEDKRDHWLFSVEDNGIGIDAEHRERIFVIFQRLHNRDKYEGTGIGLSICQKIAHQLGGRIWVESEPSKGATFFFTLPK
jgi:light-regulated signal transduction histidine kinase (bacteriophytochrome)